MKMPRLHPLWLLFAFCLRMAPALAAAPILGSVGPLSWQATQIPPTYSQAEAIKKASDYLGAGTTGQSMTAQFVQVTDSTPNGNIRQTVFYAWLVVVPALGIDKATVPVAVLLDADQRQLDAAFTAKNTQAWVMPAAGFTAQDAWQAMADDGWQVAATPQGPKTLGATVGQVLSAVWHATGISPANAGQILLRPRRAAPALPAQWQDGQLTPLLPAGTYWTAVLYGTKTREVTPPAPTSSASASAQVPAYMSGLALLIADTSARVVRGVFLY
ncbi:MAG: hypothetical protein JO171_15925 [Paludibacterium sp.]|uniref:hypothetical protein n=1 Tax=Paludibacterium sp. TaxID=1917523 RepID=UPI0025E1BB70|nr:hypothetical protein [Paludibacterium sp.]MBV8048637.1 hypothetical protein [Paludibacterium sp.]MBV8645826.1 hypothetical protein [Paludibacterium sp.]